MTKSERLEFATEASKQFGYPFVIAGGDGRPSTSLQSEDDVHAFAEYAPDNVTYWAHRSGDPEDKLLFNPQVPAAPPTAPQAIDIPQPNETEWEETASSEETSNVGHEMIPDIKEDLPDFPEGEIDSTKWPDPDEEEPEEEEPEEEEPEEEEPELAEEEPAEEEPEEAPAEPEVKKKPKPSLSETVKVCRKLEDKLAKGTSIPGLLLRSCFMSSSRLTFRGTTMEYWALPAVTKYSQWLASQAATDIAKQYARTCNLESKVAVMEPARMPARPKGALRKRFMSTIPAIIRHAIPTPTVEMYTWSKWMLANYETWLELEYRKLKKAIEASAKSAKTKSTTAKPPAKKTAKKTAPKPPKTTRKPARGSTTKPAAKTPSRPMPRSSRPASKTRDKRRK